MTPITYKSWILFISLFLDYILLLGPDNNSDGKSEVLSLPDLTPLDCNIPVFPGGDWSGYIGRSTSDGVLMCGGYVRRYEGGYFMSSCYLLTSSGYQDMPPLINLRGGAASLVTPLGLWVTGKPGVFFFFGNNFYLRRLCWRPGP